MSPITMQLNLTATEMHCVPRWWASGMIDEWAVFFKIGGTTFLWTADVFRHTVARMTITEWCRENCSGAYRVDDDCVRFDLEADAVLAMVAW